MLKDAYILLADKHTTTSVGMIELLKVVIITILDKLDVSSLMFLSNQLQLFYKCFKFAYYFFIKRVFIFPTTYFFSIGRFFVS